MGGIAAELWTYAAAVGSMVEVGVEGADRFEFTGDDDGGMDGIARGCIFIEREDASGFILDLGGDWQHR